VNTTDAFTHALLTNEEVLAVSQDALGERARRIALGGSREAWIKDLSDGGYAVGLFNRGQSDQAVSVTFGEIGISGRFVARQAWQRQDQGVLDSTVSAMVPNRGAVLVVLAPETPPDPTGGAGGMGGAAGASGAAGAAGSTDVGGAGAGADAGAGGMSGGSAAGGNASGGAGDPSGGAGDPSGGGPSAGAGQGGAGASGGAPAGSGGVAAGGAPLAGQGGSASPAGGSSARSSEEPAGCGCSLPGTKRTSAPWAVVVALAAARLRRRRAHGSPETSTR
jgi:MYXO-CTERM domain-containing protein